MAQEGASCILVQLGDTLVEERYAGVAPEQPLMAMSISKSITALGVGALVDQGHLSLDAPLSSAQLPEWAGTDKADITLRHLLTHTSRLDPTRRARDTAEQLITLTRAPAEEAGFVYNNNAVDLLGVVCQRADPSGRPLDEQLRHGAVGAVGADSASWRKDRSGTTWTSGGLRIRPRDLLRLGVLVRDGGVWGGERVLSAAWMAGMLSPGAVPHHGWLWWLDRSIPGAPVAGWRADGYLGQKLVIVPALGAVVLRMRDPETTSWDPAERSHGSLPAEVLAWLGSTDAP